MPTICIHHQDDQDHEDDDDDGDDGDGDDDKDEDQQLSLESGQVRDRPESFSRSSSYSLPWLVQVVLRYKYIGAWEYKIQKYRLSQ